MEPNKKWMQDTVDEITLLGEIETNDSFSQIGSVEDHRSKLIELITFLIDHNFEKLLWILYRIDVDEQKAKQLLSKHLPEEAPAILADLIIQRQQKKEEFRNQYAAKPHGPEDDDLLL